MKQFDVRRMKYLLILALILIPAAISCGEFRPDPVREFIESQPGIAIDLTATRSQYKVNWDLKRKNFKPGSRRG